MELRKKMTEAIVELNEFETEELKILFRGLFLGVEKCGNTKDLKIFNVVGKILLERGINYEFVGGKLLFKGEKAKPIRKKINEEDILIGTPIDLGED